METKTLSQERRFPETALEFAKRIKSAVSNRKQMLSSQREDPEIKKLKTQLSEVRREINIIRSQFNEAGEPECVAYYAYLLKANEAKYDYLLRMAREHEAKCTKQDQA